MCFACDLLLSMLIIIGNGNGSVGVMYGSLYLSSLFDIGLDASGCGISEFAPPHKHINIES